MKNKWFGAAVRIYEIWSAALFVIFLVMAGHRRIVFCIWQISNILAILLMRIPGVYWMSERFPDTLLPMGLATSAGSLLSVLICAVAFALISRRDASTPPEQA